MRRGRKPEYQRNKNIVGQDYLRSGYRYARCAVCQKDVKAQNWSKHLHGEWEGRLGQLQIRACLDEVEQMCSNTIDKEGQTFLAQHFPDGISGMLKEKYISYVYQMLLVSLTTDPRQNHDFLEEASPPRSQQSEMVPQIPVVQEKIIDISLMPVEGKIIEEEELEETPLKQALVLQEKQKTTRNTWRISQKQLDLDLFQSMFVKVQYQVSLQGLKLKSLLNRYIQGVEKVETLAKEFAPGKNKEHSLLIILKECFLCGCEINQPSGQYKQCIQCRTRVHSNCSHKFERCICGSAFMESKITAWRQFQKAYSEPQGVENEKILGKMDHHIKDFTPITPKKRIEQTENSIIHEIQRRNLHYVVSALAPKKSNSKTNALRDPFLVKAANNLVEVYQRYESGQYKAPVELMRIKEIDLGIRAMEDIPANTLICEYSCDILPMTNAQNLVYKDHVMFYANGKNSEEELILAPYNCSNWGPLINYADKGNCASLRTVIKRQIRVLIYSTQKIKKGQQLLYNYNSDVHQYPTEGFLDLK